MNTLAGDPRRLRGRVPSALWLGLAGLGGAIFLYLARDILLPFALALFLAYLLIPLVDAMSRPRPRRTTPRPVAAFLALAAFLGVGLVALLALGPILAAEANRLLQTSIGSGGHEPLITQRVVSTLASWRDKLYGTGVFPTDVQRDLNQHARDFVNGPGDAAVQPPTRSLLYFPALRAVVLALVQAPAGSPLPITVGLFALLAQQVDSHLVAPLILGRFVRVHPLLLIFSTLLGASTFGLIGMFLAAPVTAVAKETFLFLRGRVNQDGETPQLRLTG